MHCCISAFQMHSINTEWVFGVVRHSNAYLSLFCDTVRYHSKVFFLLISNIFFPQLKNVWAVGLMKQTSASACGSSLVSYFSLFISHRVENAILLISCPPSFNYLLSFAIDQSNQFATFQCVTLYTQIQNWSFLKRASCTYNYQNSS